MAKRPVPVHPRGEIIPEREPRNGRRLALLGGAVVLAAGLVTGLLLSRGGGESANTADTGGGSVPATASPFPQETSSPRPTIPARPETTAPTKPVDEHYSQRRSAAERYDRCDVASFTNGGTQKGQVRLNLDVVYENDPTSTEVRSHGENKDLHWDNPIIVAAPLDANGLPTNKNVLTFPAQGDRVEGNTSIFMPAGTATDTKYAIGILTNAITPYDGGEMETKTVTLCDTIVNEGDNHWNKSVEELTVPLITSVDVYRD